MGSKKRAHGEKLQTTGQWWAEYRRRYDLIQALRAKLILLSKGPVQKRDLPQIAAIEQEIIVHHAAKGQAYIAWEKSREIQAPDVPAAQQSQATDAPAPEAEVSA